MLKKLFISALIIGFIGALAAGVAGLWAYNYVTRDLPDFHNVEEYLPAAVTTVLANDGTVVGEFYEERRYPVKIKEVPVMIRNVFLASEESHF